MVDSYICPTCGSEVTVGAACPGCVPARTRKRSKKRVEAGPKKRKPWERDSIYDGIGIPDDEFDYEEFIQREFGKKPHHRLGIKWYWWATGAALLALLIAASLRGWW